MQPPGIVLQVLFVFRVNGPQLPVESFGKEQRCNEELGKAVQSSVKVLVTNLEVVVGRGRSSIGVRVTRVFGEVL